MLMHFLRGTLPWQGMKGATKKEKLERIKASKLSTEVRPGGSLRKFCIDFRSNFMKNRSKIR